MLDRSNPYFRQVELLVRVLPLVASEPCFALKGGTAINLFICDFPRLSVDIDLTYLPLDDRDDALGAIEGGLGRIADKIRRVIQGAKVTAAAGEAGRVQRLQIAALDRQHPRDLFDVMQLLAGGGITPALMDCFLVYLVSSNRPIAELLDPNPLPLQPVFDQQFKGMTLREVSVEELSQTRDRMIRSISQQLTDNQKAFLLSFKSGDPQWKLLEHAIASELPAVQWKLHNIRKMTPVRRAQALSTLEQVLRR